MRFSASYRLSFTLPASTTYTQSSIVIEVSAMFVEMTIFRTPAGVGSKMDRWS